MFSDPLISASTSRILQRSERQEDYEKVVDSFVDTGIVDQINNSNNQIIYGRRGTGKTHLLRYLQQKILDEPNRMCVYIDCRNLGSSTQFTDVNKPLQTRCLSLFKDILQLLSQSFLEELTKNVSDDEIQQKGLEILTELQKAVVDPKKEYIEGEILISEQLETARGAKFSISDRNLGIAIEGKKTSSAKTDSKINVISENKIFFPEIHVIIEQFLILTNRKAFVLLDEWSSLPYDIQPFLAELLKRGLIPLSNVVVKIASLEYRSNFFIHSGTKNTGLEIGSDISANIDVDDYYVYDKNPKEISDFFAEVLYRHINIDLPDNYLKEKYKIINGKTFVANVFNSVETFNELVRASEGVIRDLINLYTKAYFEVKKQKGQNIDKNIVIIVSQQWYEQDKERNLSEDLQKILTRIIREVIGEKKARSFLVPKNLENNIYLQQLFDLRVLHIVKRGYADKVNPGERYNIYTLDYGTYVDLIKTKNKPYEEYLIQDLSEENQNDIVVPFDDKRSIRRIILKERTLHLEDRNK
jgi:hypothetical protein